MAPPAAVDSDPTESLLGVSLDAQNIGSPITADSQYSSEDDDENAFSLSPSVTDYPIHWGRRYHKYKEGSYLLPNDEAEASRLDFQHAIIRKLHGERLVFSPLRDPRRILDIGTGTGIWPIELADSNVFPNAKITGTDLSPIQPSSVPENVSFEIADCTDPDWCRPAGSLDLIHARMMVSSVDSFLEFMQIARNYLKPGVGYLELHDVDPRPRSDDQTIPPKWPLTEWERLMSKGMKRFNRSRSIHIAPKLAQWMIDAGYVDVKEVVYKLPIGAWPKNRDLKQIGRAFAEVLSEGFPGFSYKILGMEGMSMSREEIEVFLADVRKCVSDRDVHSYYNLHTVYGRRPGVEEERELKKKKSMEEKAAMPPPPLPAKGQRS